MRLLQAADDFLNGIFPACGLERAAFAHKRLANALGVGGEVVTKTSLGAQKFVVNSRMVAIIGAKDFVVANRERGLAAIGAMRARRAKVLHFPGARLIAIRAAGERADGADIDTRAAFFAGELAGIVGNDDGQNAARANAEGLHVHAFIAHAHAAEAQNAARSVVINNRRPLFLGVMQFLFDETAVVDPVSKRHVL